MSETRKLVRLGLDILHNRIPEKYNSQDPQAKLRQALIDANGGSTELNYKKLRRNKAEVFEIIASTSA